MLEVGMYLKTGKVYMSGFTFSDLLHMNKHYDLLSTQKFSTLYST